jgi:hypothetical protein
MCRILYACAEELYLFLRFIINMWSNLRFYARNVEWRNYNCTLVLYTFHRVCTGHVCTGYFIRAVSIIYYEHCVHCLFVRTEWLNIVKEHVSTFHFFFYWTQAEYFWDFVHIDFYCTVLALFVYVLSLSVITVLNIV